MEEGLDFELNIGVEESARPVRRIVGFPFVLCMETNAGIQ